MCSTDSRVFFNSTTASKTVYVLVAPYKQKRSSLLNQSVGMHYVNAAVEFGFIFPIADHLLLNSRHLTKFPPDARVPWDGVPFLSSICIVG